MASASTSSHNWHLPDQVCLPRGLAAVRGSTFILYQPVSPPLERAVKEAQAYLEMRKHFDEMTVLIWLGQPFPPPSLEVRAAYAAAFASGPKVEAVAWVVDSDRSLGASVVRSVSTQMFPREAKVELFRDPVAAAAWLISVAPVLRDFGLVTVADLLVALAGVMLVLPATVVWAEEGFPLPSRSSPGPVAPSQSVP